MQRSVPVKAAWVPIAPSHVIKKNHGKGKSPLRVYIHDSPLAVFWNDKTDTPSVIGDSCLHRGASLSIGTVDSAGCVTCKYHGKKTGVNQAIQKSLTVLYGIMIERWTQPERTVSMIFQITTTFQERIAFTYTNACSKTVIHFLCKRILWIGYIWNSSTGSKLFKGFLL